MSKCFFFDLYERQDLVIVVESFDGALYQAFAQTNGQERLLYEDEVTPIRTRNLLDMKEKLREMELPIGQAFLRQNSAYDEMVGQPQREGPNTLLLPLQLQGLEV